MTICNFASSTKAFCVALSLVTFFLNASKGLAEDSGLKTVLAADLVARFDLGGSDATDSLEVRGVELGLYGPIDHTFDGAISFASHPSEEGPYLELHEAVISATRLPLPVQVKVGEFFLGVGRLNAIHQHERPFIASPKIHTLVFDDAEGAKDTGAEVKWLAPWALPTELSLGVTNGWTFGHSHTKGTQPDRPLVYSRLTIFGDSALLGAEHSSSGLLVGVSYLSRRPDQDQGPDFDLFGADVTLKIRRGNQILWLWQSEGWYRELFAPSASVETLVGGYSVAERHAWDRLFLGLRAEGMVMPGQRDLLGRTERNQTLALGPLLSWKHSEFQTFRMEVLFEHARTPARTTESQSLALQSNFILGAHPAHDF